MVRIIIGKVCSASVGHEIPLLYGTPSVQQNEYVHTSLSLGNVPRQPNYSVHTAYYAHHCQHCRVQLSSWEALFSITGPKAADPVFRSEVSAVPPVKNSQSVP